MHQAYSTQARCLCNNAPSLLRLSFADVDFQKSELSSRAKSKFDAAFDQKHAGQICNFIESLPVEISSAVMHREGRYSLSMAVVQALHDLYGFQVDEKTLQQANHSALSLLKQEGFRRKRAK